MTIRPGALPHTITALVLDRDTGTLEPGTTWRARVDPSSATDGADVAASGEASWQIVAAPGAELLRAEDAFLFGDRLLYCYGDALPISGATAAVHHVELDARTAPGFGDSVIITRPSGRNDGVLDDATGVFTRTAGVVTYAGPARLTRPSAASTIGADGDALEAEASYVLFVPWLDPTDYTSLADGADEVEPFYAVEVVDCSDVSLVGAFLQITARGHASPALGRSFVVDLVEASTP